MIPDPAFYREAGEIEFTADGLAWRPVTNALVNQAHKAGWPSRITICDETLREGEETPGVYLDLTGRLTLARKLEELGVPEVEVGYVGAIREHDELARKLKAEGFKPKLVSHTRLYTKEGEWRDELSRAVDAGSDVLCLLCHASHTLERTTPWVDYPTVLRRVEIAVDLCRQLGAVPAVTLVDGVRTPFARFTEFYRVAAQAGAGRLYVMDGQGVALPETISFLVSVLRCLAGPGAEVAVHCHDDYGLALANTLAGVRAGATVVDTVVNGLGDKAGIAATEEVAMALEILMDIRTGINLRLLFELSKTVESVFGVPVAPDKPLVGENIVRHQIDSHLNTLIRGVWWAWECVHPSFFGRTRSLEWATGKLRLGRSGSIDAKLEKLGISVSEEQYEVLAEKLREEVEKNRVVGEIKLEELIREIIEKQGG